MKIKISATFEGKCSLCHKNDIVFTAGDEETLYTVTICKKCADKLGNKSLEDAIKEYGKKDEISFKEGLKIEKMKKIAS